MMLRKFIFFSLIFLSYSNIFGQGMTVDNARVNTSAGTILRMSGTGNTDPEGDFTLKNGGILNNTGTLTTVSKVKNQNASIINNTGTINMGGDFINSGTATIDNGGTIKTGGNWTNNAVGNNVFIARDGIGVVEFNGTTTQILSGTTTRFENLTINNTTVGTAISLSVDQIVENIATLTDGIITTAFGKYLIIESTIPTSLTAYSNISFINGNLRRYVAGIGTAFGFPVGNGTATTNYYLMEMKPTALVSGGFTYLDAKFGAYSAGGVLGISEATTSYTSISADGEWTLKANIAPTSVIYDAKVFTTNIVGLANNQFSVVQRPVGSANAADWVCTPCGFSVAPAAGINANGGLGRLVADGYALRRGLSSFANFGIAKSGVPLPIQLTSFTSSCNNNKVVLKWVTASEINNDYFSVEQSLNGVNFYELDRIIGAGNSNEKIEYSYKITSLTNGNYFRLKQVDYDGTPTYSGMLINAGCTTDNKGFELIQTSKNQWQIKHQIENSEIDVTLINYTGQKIKLIQNNNIENKSITIKTKELATGIYFVVLTSKYSIVSKKIFIR